MSKSREHDGFACTSLIEQDCRGDIILSIRGKNENLCSNVRCCSRILELASNVFAAMLGPRFVEGSTLRKQASPLVTLHEDHPEAMVHLLYLLHYAGDSPTFDGKPPSIAAVAVQADKYHCGNALRAWAEIACRPYTDVRDPEPGSFAYLIVAGHLLALPVLDRLLVDAVKHVSPSWHMMWDPNSILMDVPTKATGK